MDDAPSWMPKRRAMSAASCGCEVPGVAERLGNAPGQPSLRAVTATTRGKARLTAEDLEPLQASHVVEFEVQRCEAMLRRSTLESFRLAESFRPLRSLHLSSRLRVDSPHSGHTSATARHLTNTRQRPQTHTQSSQLFLPTFLHPRSTPSRTPENDPPRWISTTGEYTRSRSSFLKRVADPILQLSVPLSSSTRSIRRKAPSKDCACLKRKSPRNLEKVHASSESSSTS